MMNTRIEELGLRIESNPSDLKVQGHPVGASLLANAFRQQAGSYNKLRACKGFTLIELIVVITIIVVLGGIFLTRVPLYQEQAEKSAMQQVEGALQSALVLRFGAMMARSTANEKELHTLSTDNPVMWLQKIPPNYKGEYYDPSSSTVPPGNWMFDLKSRELIYFVDHSDNFKAGKDGKNWIRFHVHLDYEPVLGHPESGKELVTTLFEPTAPYRWLE